MKFIKLSARITNRIKSNSEEVYNLEKGITRALLDKYKPKALYNIEELNERKDQGRVS